MLATQRFFNVTFSRSGGGVARSLPTSGNVFSRPGGGIARSLPASGNFFSRSGGGGVRRGHGSHLCCIRCIGTTFYLGGGDPSAGISYTTDPLYKKEGGKGGEIGKLKHSSRIGRREIRRQDPKSGMKWVVRISQLKNKTGGGRTETKTRGGPTNLSQKSQIWPDSKTSGAPPSLFCRVDGLYMLYDQVPNRNYALYPTYGFSMWRTMHHRWSSQY